MIPHRYRSFTEQNLPDNVTSKMIDALSENIHERDCEQCYGSGWVYASHSLGSMSQDCPVCGGSGRSQTDDRPSKYDLACERADAERDRERDERNIE